MIEPIITVNVPGHIIPQKLKQGRGRVYRPKDYRICMQKCVLFVKQAVTASPISCDFPLTFKVRVDVKGKRCHGYDKDKFLGTLYDSLEKGGVIKNDNQIEGDGKFSIESIPLNEQWTEYTEIKVYRNETS